MNRNLAFLTTNVWAMRKSDLDGMVARARADAGVDLFGPLSNEQRAVVEARSAPTLFDETGIVEAATRRGPKSGTVAVVPVRGAIMYRDSVWSFLFGGTSVQRLITTINELAANESVSTILLDFDSPGGTSEGLTELAAAVRSASQVKNIVAVANNMMCSAAYWIGSAADEIIAPDVSYTGSVGCYLYHEDWSGAYAEMGISPTYIYTPEYKVEGNDTEPLSDEARADMQHIVDSVYGMFVADVAAGRKVDAAKVKNDYGSGRAMLAKDAKAAGLIDRVGTFNDTLTRLVGTRGAADVAASSGLLVPTGTNTTTMTNMTISFDGSSGVKVNDEPHPDDPPEDIPEDVPPTPDPEPPTTEAQLRSQRWRIASL